MESTKVLLVDDHEIFRNGVRQLVDKEPDLEVVAEASDGYEAIKQAEIYQPDIILMDISMPSLNGLDASTQLLSTSKSVRILFLSLYDREDYIMNALNMGAHGYILKDESNKVFLKAIRKVSSGEFYFSGDTSNIIIGNLQTKNTLPVTVAEKKQEVFRLSKREAQILTEIAAGFNNKSISENLSVSIRTIETHRLNIMRKLRVKNIDQCVEIARREDLIS